MKENSNTTEDSTDFKWAKNKNLLILTLPVAMFIILGSLISVYLLFTHFSEVLNELKKYGIVVTVFLSICALFFYLVSFCFMIGIIDLFSKNAEAKRKSIEGINMIGGFIGAGVAVTFSILAIVDSLKSEYLKNNISAYLGREVTAFDIGWVIGSVLAFLSIFRSIVKRLI